jgi:hypothetical protein
MRSRFLPVSRIADSPREEKDCRRPKDFFTLQVLRKESADTLNRGIRTLASDDHIPARSMNHSLRNSKGELLERHQ